MHISHFSETKQANKPNWISDHIFYWPKASSDCPQTLTLPVQHFMIPQLTTLDQKESNMAYLLNAKHFFWSDIYSWELKGMETLRRSFKMVHIKQDQIINVLWLMLQKSPKYSSISVWIHLQVRTTEINHA